MEKKFYIKTLLVLAGLGLAETGVAQEVSNGFVPLKITSGLNADVIAEKLAEESKNTYESKYATFLDADSYGGRNSFYTKDIDAGYFSTNNINSDGIEYTEKTEYGINGKHFLANPMDNIDYYLEDASGGNNACLIRNDKNNNNNEKVTLAFSAVDDKQLPYGSVLYLLATSVEGDSKVNIKIYGEDGNLIIEKEGIIVGDWWFGHELTDEKGEVIKDEKGNSINNMQTPVYIGHRVTVKGTWFDNIPYGEKYGYVNTDDYADIRETYINYFNGGGGHPGVTKDKKTFFAIQRIEIPLSSYSAVSRIEIEKIKGGSNLCIFAATVATDEVTLKDGETSLSYLKNEVKNQIIQHGVKNKVNFHRNFNEGWNALVFPCPMTAKEVHEMFGDDVELSVATANSFKGNKVIFYPVDLSDETSTDKVIERGKYYLIKGVKNVEEKDDKGFSVYSRNFQLYNNPENIVTSKEGWVPVFTTTNEKGDILTFRGTYVSGKNVPEGSYALATDGKFYKYTSEPVIGGFRFWFTVTDASGNAKSNPLSFEVADGKGETTAIETIGVDGGMQNKDGSDNVYSIDGRIVRNSSSLDGLAKGLYIVNNKKVVIK